MNFKKSEGLIFGIYPGSGVGLETGLGRIKGKKDDAISIKAALENLSGDKPFLVRSYIQYIGSGKSKNKTPQNFEYFCKENIKLDLAICYRTNEHNMKDWRNFIKTTITEYKNVLAKIQITEEPNNPDTNSGGDGSSLYIKEAIIEGVLAAKETITELGLDIQNGFNAVISFNPQDTFWRDFAKLNTVEFTQALDYIGLDFYPDVFRPLPPNLTLKDAVIGVIQHYRNNNLPEGGIPNNLPLHITENGWPTNKERSEEKQAIVVQHLIETIFEIRKRNNITHYEFFNLRDIDSSGKLAQAQLESSGNNFQFGLMRDDYIPKPSYTIYKNLINQMS